jgi:agmatine deiminase
MTDGHVDGVCAFSRPGHLLVDATLDGHSTYGRVVRENRRALALATDARGRSFECLELFEASEAVDAEAEVFCASYTNFYIANGAIIMPAYGVGADEAAGRC